MTIVYAVDMIFRSEPNYSLRRKFGVHLAELRKKKGLTQEEFADLARIARSYVSSIERGAQNVSLDNIGKLAKTLKVSLGELFNF
jgi:transcriptional regulator with XRE-family HTH domain